MTEAEQDTKPPPAPAPARRFQAGRMTGTVHVVASPYKTGTSSLGNALVTLGIGQSEMPYRAKMLRPYQHALQAFNAAAEEARDAFAFLSDHRATARGCFHELTSQLAAWDVFSDYPFGHDHMHPFLRKALAPEARFLWVNRDFEAWTGSVRRWEESHPKTYPHHVLWTENPQARLRALKRRWTSRKQQFQRLADAFPDHCLELNLDALDQDMGPLCAFYGIAPPAEMAFPKRNVSSPS